MKYILILIVAIMVSACEKQDVYDSGLANGRFEGSTLEYLESGRGTWDSIVVAIRHAGLESVFNGTDPQVKNGITFFGPTNNSVRQFLYKTVDADGEVLYRGIMDMPVELCRRMVLAYVVPKKMMKAEFEYENRGTLTGGTEVETLTGIKLRVYRIKSDYGSASDAGPVSMAFESLPSGHIVNIASADIEPDNSVVHSLVNAFEWTEL